ncbi:MAG TPA: DUF11 domain-containing protein, partial [Roseiflexaceae bacterium]|nr:DUF11 domain-containing protein [Roseiflexaceae bacterium]
LIGWAPGSVAAPPTNALNGSTVYVQALAPGTIVTADLDGDGAPDAFDINGDGDALDANAYGYNEQTSALGVALNRGQTLRISDPVDHDMTGALISAQDNQHRIAVVFGEDACRATRALPYLDLGYTVLPLPVPELNKTARLAVDADRSGDISPGDTLEYTVRALNSGVGPIEQPVLTDTLPYTYTSFILGSITSTPAPLVLPGVAYDDGSGTFGYIPTGAAGNPDARVHAFRISGYADLPPGAAIEVTFRVQLRSAIPPDVRSVTNSATLSGRNLAPLSAQAITPINQADVQIHKTDGADVVRPGQQLTYTLTYTNAGPGIAHNVVMTDTLPPTAINVSTPAVPGVITPTIDLARHQVILQLGTLPAGHVGRTTVTLTLGPGTVAGTSVVNTVFINTTSHDPDLSNNRSGDIDRVPSTTAVILSAFSAERRVNGVLVSWRTVAELDNYGFRVYRSRTPSRADAELVTPQIIPGRGRGRAGGADYSIFDGQVPDGPLYYWLEDIDLNGVSSFHGPAAPQLAAARMTWFLPIVAARR